MTQQEAYKIVCEMGAHPYSRQAMVAALQKGIEIGKAEQTEELLKYLEKKRDALAEISRCDFYDLSHAFGGVKYLDEIINELSKQNKC